MPMNEIITNLSGDHVTHEEETILRFGVLKYDLATRPNESQIITTAASLWRQLKRENLIPDSFIKLHKFKTSIKALAKYLIPEVAKYLTKLLNPSQQMNLVKKIALMPSLRLTTFHRTYSMTNSNSFPSMSNLSLLIFLSRKL